MNESNGVIYILTNPSFPEYVKIGYADDIERRLQELNRSECVPFAFRVYATYEVDSRLSDLKIHSIIDKLNPNLRSIDDFDGKKRVREFYAMSPEDAYSILEAIAEIHNCGDKLKLVTMNETEKEAAAVAEEIIEESRERRAPFAFSRCGINVGSEIVSVDDPSIVCVVVDDKYVECNGEKHTLSYLAKGILGTNYFPNGPAHFSYNGERLDKLRKRIENKV